MENLKVSSNYDDLIHTVARVTKQIEQSGMLEIDPALHDVETIVDFLGAHQAIMNRQKKMDSACRAFLKSHYQPHEVGTKVLEGKYYSVNISLYERVKDSLLVAIRKFKDKWSKTPEVSEVVTLKVVTKKK